MPSPPSAFPRRRPALAAAGAALAVALLAWLGWAQLPGHGLFSPREPATGAAEWIWMDGGHERRAPAAFYAVRDFRLAEPAAAAELMVLADEEYQAFVNGSRVGSGAWRPGATIDRYAVGDRLRRGVNRLVVEVRSGRGTGGLLACLADPASGRVLVATGRDWRIVAHHPAGLFRGWEVSWAPHAFSWGLPPTGRWGEVEPGPLRRPGPDADVKLGPQRVRALGPGGRWLRPVAGVRVPRRERRVGGVLLDWGREVTGHLALRLDADQGLRTALLFLGDRPFDPLGGAPPGDRRNGEPAGESDGDGWIDGGEGRIAPDAAVVVIPDRPGWTDAVTRRFRYATVLGATPVAEAWIDPPSEWEIPEPAADGRRGVLGIEPPPLRTPVEDEVRRQLQGFARRARR